MPIGIANLLANGFGVAGAVVGMAEVWYTGPLGKKAGGMFGTDLGFEVCGVVGSQVHRLNQCSGPACCGVRCCHISAIKMARDSLHRAISHSPNRGLG